MSENNFKLGDRVVKMGGCYLRRRRTPFFEGTVTAVGNDCIRVKVFSRILFWFVASEKWHSTIHEEYNFTKTEQF